MEKTTQPQFKVAIIGPESSGKTTLCKQLSDTLNCDWVPEFARKHLSENPNYIQIDLDYMLEQQLLSENKYKHHLLICDGDPISFKVWSQYKYGSTSKYIEQMIIDSNYAHFLLLQPDLPYEKDPLRENSSLAPRRELFDLFKNELDKHNLNYSVVDGLNKKRLIVALNSLKEQKII
ncbi:MAG: NadR type nicotinamide-nucleotide adenylyltransferase [Vicingaceae bacterium]|jgi:NadR type nicotinamide-nucleotide adenylyltransferase